MSYSFFEQSQSKKQILIVDDSEINRSILADMLGSMFHIVEAENGLDAIAYIREHENEISLILLDVVMPELDGFGVLEAMNKQNWIDLIPVIMISAETVPSYVERAYDLGVADYINRPFDGRIVRRRVMNTIMLYANQKMLTGMVADQIYEKEKNNNLMIEMLSNVVEFRDSDSGKHVLHIHTLTELMLKRLIQRTNEYVLTLSDVALISNASPLHDIGKITISEEILNKPGKLTPEEFKLIQTHSAEGAAMLEKINAREDEPLLRVAYEICRWHHERWDGKGYPDGLAGNEIPISAQVVALADVYDALTSARVYKPAYSHKEAMKMILGGECGAFNPLLLSCLIDIEAELETALNEYTSEQNAILKVRNITNEMIENSRLNASDRTFRLMEQERIKYRFFASMSREVQFEYNTEPDTMVFSEWGARQLGIDENIVNPRNSAELARVLDQNNLDDLFSRLDHTTPETPIVENNYLLNIGGAHRWCKLVARTLWSEDDADGYVGIIGKFVDVHEEQERINDLENMASHDGLTGLYNHASMKTYIENEIAKNENGKYAMILFDLDDFKSANDQYGHLFGNKVLQHVSQKIMRIIRSTDAAARIGGDEFMIFMEYTKDATAQVERVFGALNEMYEDFQISVSMGISLWPQDGLTYEEMFHGADQALYSSKRKGKSHFLFYTPLNERQA